MRHFTNLEIAVMQFGYRFEMGDKRGFFSGNTALFYLVSHAQRGNKLDG